MLQSTTLRIAVLDLYEGQPNQGMRCIRQILQQWGKDHQQKIQCDEFDVRLLLQVPDLSYDIYISTGGPGSPLDSIGAAWETAYFNWLSSIEDWNNNSQPHPKKFVFFICHSFELICRHYNVAAVTRRKSTAFGIFPVHFTAAGKKEIVFEGLQDPFYVVDSRDWQVVQPNEEKLKLMGAEILCIEKERPHVPYERAIMAIRFSDCMIGSQFHPEADAAGMSHYLQTEDIKTMVTKNYGEDKWQSMIEGLNDPDKIMWTYAHILPNFLNIATQRFLTELAS